MITLKDITKTFPNKEGGLHAVDHVSLDIGEGEIYGIVGYSGAGKSTLVRCINFLEKPNSGSIQISGFGTIETREGRACYLPEGTAPGSSSPGIKLTEKHLKALRRDIGMIFQLFNLMDRNTVFENVAYPLKYKGLKKAQIRARVLELLDLVDLRDKVNAYPSELSGGQKQRVAIARALANNPKILLSDEATSALDPDATESILKLLKELNRKLNLTIVLITHEMAVVKAICDKVAVMENGRIVEEGNVYDVFSSPRQPITKKFVDSSSGLGNIAQLAESGFSVVTRDGVLIKCTFGKDSVGDALISDVSCRFNVKMNIILGNVEMLQGAPLGRLVVLVSGESSQCQAAIDYMRSCDVKVEVIEHA